MLVANIFRTNLCAMDTPNQFGSTVTHHPLSWRDWASSPRTVASEPQIVAGAIVQRWESSARRMKQPRLDHHYLVVHLGGDKRVTRAHGGRSIAADVRNCGFTTVEAGSEYSWRTEGPIAFGHVYIEPRWYAELIGEGFDRDPANIRLDEEVGGHDPLIGHLLAALVQSSAPDDVSVMEQQAALEAVLHRLFEHQAAVPQRDSRMLIPSTSVRRVSDYIAENLGEVITLDKLAQTAGYSRFHFARGFRAATGMPPYAFVIRKRIARACEMLAERDIPIGSIAAATGFASHAQFSSRFRQVTGLAPSAFRAVVI
jgi:AraC family transcriptional regulator